MYKPLYPKRLFIILLFIVFAFTVYAENAIQLSGEWKFQLDPCSSGFSEKWYLEDLNDTILLPGSIEEQGYGEDIAVDTAFVWRKSVPFKDYPMWPKHPMYKKYIQSDNVVMPYFLNPDKHYLGLAWFQKKVTIPDNWGDKKIKLKLERCHWKTYVWVDSNKIGEFDSLATPHRYDCSNFLSPGDHTITIAVDNRMIHEIGLNSHSITNHTQTPWNGIIGNLNLTAKSIVNIDDIQIYPNIRNKTIKLKLALEGVKEAEFGKLKLTSTAFNTNKPHTAKSQEYPVFFADLKPEIEVVYKLGKDAQLWDEFQPTLYKLDISLNLDGRQKITKSVDFGLREIKVEGKNIIVNERKSMMRGNISCCEFPLTGYPSMEIEYWQKIMRQCKNYGLNHLRFHSWCPPKAAFIAADEAGIYLQPECNIWAGVFKKNSDIAAYVWAEWHRILKEYGNHPSFMLYAVGNEGYMKPQLMTELLDYSKSIDNRRIYTGYANGFQGDNTDFDIKISLNKRGNKDLERRKKLRIRYQAGWPPKPENSYFNTMQPNTNLDYDKLITSYPKPVIQHESVQHCSYPNVDDIKKYNGILKPGYLIIARDQLAANGLLQQNDHFIKTSGRWQVQFFKEEIEAVLRTKDFAGFQLLQLQDFPGQGTALVGVLDTFWDSKGYVSGEEFRSFCGPTVPLVRMTKRVFLDNESFSAKLDIAHFGPKEFNSVIPEWLLKDENGKIVKSGKLKNAEVPIGNGINIGEIKFELSDLNVPAKYTLNTIIKEAETTNYWDLWVYPSKLIIPEIKDIIISNELDQKTTDKLLKGSKVLLLPSKEYVAGNVKPCFSLIYWNCPWTDGGEVDTLGMLCDPKHEIFKYFPTDFHTNWQWWDLMQKSKPMILSGLPVTFKPVLQIIDDWNLNRRLGLIIEAKIGKGKLLICSMDMDNDLQSRPAARQLKYSILKYMQTENFNPENELNLSDIKTCFAR